MKKIKMRTLRSILFLLLALVFAVLAVIEGLPKSTKSDFSQATAFTVTSQKNSNGSYSHLVQGSIRNDSSNSKFLDGVIVRVYDRSGTAFSMELEVGTMAPGEVRKLSGSLTSSAPATGKVSVNTSALSGGLAITVPETGLQFNKGFIIFAVLAVLSFGMSAFFFVNRMTHRHHHHHHHHHHHEKTEDDSQKA